MCLRLPMANDHKVIPNIAQLVRKQALKYSRIPERDQSRHWI